jgi:hypothetical protein
MAEQPYNIWKAGGLEDSLVLCSNGFFKIVNNGSDKNFLDHPYFSMQNTRITPPNGKRIFDCPRLPAVILF